MPDALLRERVGVAVNALIILLEVVDDYEAKMKRPVPDEAARTITVLADGILGVANGLIDAVAEPNPEATTDDTDDTTTPA